MATTIKDLWIKPTPLLLNAKEFSFGYKENDKEREYTVKVKDKDDFSFKTFVHIILDSKNKAEKNKGQTVSPWPQIVKRGLKNKVVVENPKDDAVQMELPLKVAQSFLRSI